MNELYQSPILYSLGWAIAGSFWQMGLLWLIYQLVAGIPFRHKPGIKHGASVIFMGIGSLWFMVSFFQQLYSVREVQSYINRVDLNSDQFIVNKSGSFAAMVEEAEKFLPYFSTAYLIILMILFFRLAQGLVLTYQISSTKNIIHAPQWQHYVDKLCVQLNIGREVLIYLSETINVPATIGFIKPIILLPVATVNQLTITQAEAIILHEIAHIKRFDYLLNIIVSILETILFFNPFARLFSLNIRKERELCCDDFVIRYQRDPHGYAHALLSLEKSRNVGNLAMAATGKESLLLGRIKRILQIPDQQVQFRHRIIAVFFLALMIMFVSLLNPPKKQIENFPTASYLAKQQDAGQLYYSLPGIFQPTVKESGLSSFQSLGQTTQVRKRSLPEKKDSYYEIAREKTLYGDYFQAVPSSDDLAMLSFPKGIPAPVGVTAPFAENNFSFEYKTETDEEPTPDGSVHERRPSSSSLIRLNNENFKALENLQFNEESLSKFFEVIDFEKLITDNEKLKIAIDGKPMQEMIQNELLQRQSLMKRKSQMQRDMRVEWDTEHQDELAEIENRKHESAEEIRKKESRQFKILSGEYLNDARRRAESDVEYERPKEPKAPVYSKSYSVPKVYYQPQERKRNTGAKVRTEKDEPVIFATPDGFEPPHNEDQIAPVIHGEKAPTPDGSPVIKTDKKTRQVIKTFTSQDGSTISIVQDKGQIEIRLKGNR